MRYMVLKIVGSVAIVVAAVWSVLLFSGLPDSMVSQYESTYGELWVIVLSALDFVLLLTGITLCVAGVVQRKLYMLAVLLVSVPLIHLHAAYHHYFSDVLVLLVGIVALAVSVRRKRLLWFAIAVLALAVLGATSQFVSSETRFVVMALYPLVLIPLVVALEWPRAGSERVHV